MGKNKHLSSEAKAAKALESRNKSYLPEDKLPPAPSARMVRKEMKEVYLNSVREKKREIQLVKNKAHK